MKSASVIWLAASAALLPLAWAAGALGPSPDLVPRSVLAFDAELKQIEAKPNQTEAYFTFWVTNVCATNVPIFNVATSCGCTVAQLPSLPWLLQPGESGPIKVTLDLRGCSGVLMKGVRIISSAGVKELVARVNLPASAAPRAGPVSQPCSTNAQTAPAPAPARRPPPPFRK